MKRKILLLAPAILSLSFLVGCKNNVKEHTVTFNSQSGSKVEAQKVPDGLKAVEPKSPTRTGYMFNKWTTDQEGKNEYKFDTVVKNSFELYAQYSDKFYIVTFDPGDGKMSEEHRKQQVRDGDLIAPPPEPTKTGYTFVEWQLNGEKFDMTSKIKTSITLKAKYSAFVFDVTVKSESDSRGTVVGTKKYNYGELATVTATPKEGYTFKGWYSDDEGERLLSNSKNYSFIVDKEIKLVAKFDTHSYDITYHNVTDDQHKNPKTYTIESQAITLKPARKEHYIFDGWFKNSSLTEKITAIPALSTGDIDLYGKWHQAKGYVVIFDTLCTTDECYDAVDVKNGTIAYDPKYNYDCVWADFKGWYYENGGVETKFVFEGDPSGEQATTVNNNMYLYAKYENVKTEETKGLEYSLNSMGGYSVFANEKARSKKIIIPAAKKLGDYYVLINEIQSMQSCYYMTEVVIPPTVEIISSHAFDGRKFLNKVTFDNINKSKLGYINAFAFRYANTASITLPDSVVLIKDDAFNCVHDLREINIPKNAIIMYGAFLGCNHLSNIIIPDDCKYYTNTIDSVMFTHAIFEKTDNPNEFNLLHQSDSSPLPSTGVVKFCEKSFWSLPIQTLAIPNSVKYIDYGVFRDCRSLNSVSLMEDSELEVIGVDAFRHSTINTIRIPSKVKEIKSGAFAESYLENVRIDSETVANFTNNDSEVFRNNVLVKKYITLSPSSYLISSGYKPGAEVDGYITYSK